jgi:hypothetical protein
MNGRTIRILAAAVAATLVGITTWDYASLNRCHLVHPLANHQSMLLKDGRVLVLGGQSPIGYFGRYVDVNPNPEIFEPNTRTWQEAPAAPFTVIKAAELNDGRFVTVNYSQMPGPGDLSVTKIKRYIIQIFDPNTGTWQTTATPGRLNPEDCVVLNSGDVFFWMWEGAPQIFHPASLTWSETSKPLIARDWEKNMVKLGDGTLLVAGGRDPKGTTTIDACEIYDPEKQTWRKTDSLNPYEGEMVLIALSDGRAMAIEKGVIEVYDPKLGVWSRYELPNWLRSPSTAVTLHNGKILLIGPTCGLFSTATQSWEKTEGTWTFRAGSSAVVLNDGKVLLSGGFDGDIHDGNAHSDECDLFDPDTSSWSELGFLGNPS